MRIVSLRPYSIVLICVCLKQAGPLDTFLNKLRSSNLENQDDFLGAGNMIFPESLLLSFYGA